MTKSGARFVNQLINYLFAWKNKNTFKQAAKYQKNYYWSSGHHDPL